jgi:hypothetical protein
MASIAEAHLGLGNEAESQTILQDAFAIASSPMKESTQEQLTKLRTLIIDSPIKYIHEN